jgi:hypothetical protein
VKDNEKLSEHQNSKAPSRFSNLALTASILTTVPNSKSTGLLWEPRCFSFLRPVIRATDLILPRLQDEQLATDRVHLQSYHSWIEQSLQRQEVGRHPSSTGSILTPSCLLQIKSENPLTFLRTKLTLEDLYES